MFCFFPFLCLKAQDVDFSLTREETYVDLGTGSHLFIRCKKPDGKICNYVLPVQDQHLVKVESGESYLRTIDISRYVSGGTIEKISAVANVCFDDAQGKLKIVRMEKEIP